MKTNRLTTLISLVAVVALTSAFWFSSEENLPSDAAGNATVASNAFFRPGAFSSSTDTYDLGAHQTLSRVILLIRENYVDPERVDPYEMFVAALDYIEKTGPEVIVDSTSAPDFVTISVGEGKRRFEVRGLDQLWEVTMALRNIFRFMESHLRETTKPQDIEYAAINGMLSTLDPHSLLLKPESFDEVKMSTKGEFGGLGIVISIREGKLTVISPIGGTPASRAGIRARDVIARIGEESTVNMGLEEAVSRLRGKPGSPVDIWILRKGWTEPKRFGLTRAIIKIESVTSELLADGVGYIRIKSFQGNTYGDLHSHLEKLRAAHGQPIKGLVLDLRNNPGGLLDQAILISDRFIDKGALVITVGEGNRKRDVKSAHLAGTDTDYPIAVLVNGGSASASEIVAGALKNHDRAVIVGERSFGKGSVQVLYDFKDRSALKLTIAQYLTPGDLSIQSVGIEPDITLVPATLEKDSIHVFVDDMRPRERDLKKHLNQYRETQETSGESEYKVLHLVEAEPEPDEAQEQESVSEKFQSDFEIEFAQKLLASSRSLHRQKILKEGKRQIQAVTTHQEGLIAARLNSLGVDWSEGQSKGSGQARAQLRVKEDKGQGVQAGDTITLVGVVENIGKSPLYQVYGTTSSDSMFFDNLEFVFGHLAPGEKRRWEIEVKLTRGIDDRVDAVELVLGDQHNLLTEVKSQTFVHVVEQPKPRFSFSVQVDDRAGGNGDGLLQVDEQVGLRVRVTNLGKGNAGDVMLVGKNITGPEIFLDVGRSQLGEIKVGESQQAMLQFSVRDMVEKAKLRVSIWDTELGAIVTEELELPVMEVLKARRDVKSVRVRKGVEAPIYAGASEDSDILGYARSGADLRSDTVFAQKWRRVRLHKLTLSPKSKPLKKGNPQWVQGYIRGEDVRVLKKIRKSTRDGVRYLNGEASPLIELTLPELRVSGDSFQLSAMVGDESGLKDVFVFSNDSKIYYRSLSSLVKGSEGYRSSVNMKVPLEIGANMITIVVRESETLSTRKSFGIYREAVNIAANKAKPKDVSVH